MQVKFMCFAQLEYYKKISNLKLPPYVLIVFSHAESQMFQMSKTTNKDLIFNNGRIYNSYLISKHTKHELLEVAREEYTALQQVRNLGPIHGMMQENFFQAF